MLLLNLWSNHFWLLDWHLVSDSFFKFSFLNSSFLIVEYLSHIWSMLKGWSNQMIYVQVRSITVSVFSWYCWLCSIGSVRQDCNFFSHMGSWNWFVGRINHCLYCRLCLLNWLKTLFYLLNMGLVGEQKYMHYCMEKKQIWVKPFIYIFRADLLAAISIREFTRTISEALRSFEREHLC